MRPLLGALALLVASVLPAAALWSPVPDPGDFDGIEVFLGGDDALYAGTFVGLVYGSQDHGDSWTLVADGLDEQAYAPVLSLRQAGDWLIVSREIAEDHNYRSQRVGGVWTPWQPLAYQDDVLRNLEVDGSALYATVSSVPQRSDDLGDSWTPLAQPDGAILRRVFPAGGYLFGVEDQINSGGIYRSADGGQSWTDVTGPLTSSYLLAQTVFRGELLLSVYHNGGIGSLWRSPDWGGSWQQVTGLPTGSTNLNGLAVGNGLLALGASGSGGGQGSIFLTADLVDYQPYTGDLPAFAQPVNLLLAHDGWLFKTGGSVTKYRAPLPDPTAVGGAPAMAARLSAYPSPFNPRVTLRYELDRAGDARLAVYDVAGRELAVLAAGEHGAGPHEAIWDGRDAEGRELASGVYLARLAAASGDRMQRLVLVR